MPVRAFLIRPGARIRENKPQVVNVQCPSGAFLDQTDRVHNRATWRFNARQGILDSNRYNELGVELTKVGTMPVRAFLEPNTRDPDKSGTCEFQCPSGISYSRRLFDGSYPCDEFQCPSVHSDILRKPGRLENPAKFQCPSGHFLIQTYTRFILPRYALLGFNARQGIS